MQSNYNSGANKKGIAAKLLNQELEDYQQEMEAAHEQQASKRSEQLEH